MADGERHSGLGVKVVKNAQGQVVVEGTAPGGPADGILLPGDIICEITNKKPHKITPATQIEYVKRKLMGAPKSMCMLRVQRGREMLQVRVRRGGFSAPPTSATPSVDLSAGRPALLHNLASRTSTSSGQTSGGHSSGERSNAGRVPAPIAASALGLASRAPPARPPAQATRAIRTMSIRSAAGPAAKGGVPYCGVGLFIDRGKNGCMVCGIEPGSAAEASEIEVGDCFVKIGNTDVRDLEVEAIRELLKGPLGTQVAVLVLKQRENWAARLVTFSRFPSKSGAFLATRLPGGGRRTSVLKKGSDRSSRDLDAAARSMRNSRSGRIVPPAMPPPPPPPPMPVFTARDVKARSPGGIVEQPNVLPSQGRFGGGLRAMGAGAAGVAAGGKELVKKWTAREDPDSKRAAEAEARAGEMQRRAAERAAEAGRVEAAEADAVAVARRRMWAEAEVEAEMEAEARRRVRAEQVEADEKWQVQQEGEARRRAVQEAADHAMAARMQEDLVRDRSLASSSEERDRILAVKLQEQLASSAASDASLSLRPPTRAPPTPPTHSPTPGRSDGPAMPKFAPPTPPTDSPTGRDGAPIMPRNVPPPVPPPAPGMNPRNTTDSMAPSHFPSGEIFTPVSLPDGSSRSSHASSWGDGAVTGLVSHSLNSWEGEGDGGEGAQDGGAWQAFRDSEHNIDYFFNESTQETVWELPPGARVFRGDAHEGQELPVGGMFTLTGDSQDPENASGTPSSASESDASTTSEDEEGAGAAAGGERGGGAGEEMPLPEGWEILLDDETNHEYYFHQASGTVQWEHPNASLEEPSEAGHASYLQAASATPQGGGSPARAERAEGGETASVEWKRASVNMNRTSVHLMSEPSGEQISAAAAQEVQDLQDLVSKLMLGNDFSGGSRADSPAITVSHAITNLAAATMGELHQLGPLSPALAAKWGKELDWLLKPLERIVKMEPGKKTASDGSEIEVMIPVKVHSKDLALLRDLDSRLTALQARFHPGDLGVEYRKAQKGDAGSKWWVMVPVVPAPPPQSLLAGVRDSVAVVRLALDNVRDLNQRVLVAMPVPEEYLAALPKNAKEVLTRETARVLKNDAKIDVRRFISACAITSALTASDLMSKLQDAALVWEQKGPGSAATGASNARLIASQMRSRFPEAPQTRLETRKIGANGDVGLAAIEALSRVLEGRASLINQRLMDICHAAGLQL